MASLRRWRDAESCFAPPVLVAGDVLGTNIGYELLVGLYPAQKFTGAPGLGEDSGRAEASGVRAIGGQ